MKKLLLLFFLSTSSTPLYSMEIEPNADDVYLNGMQQIVTKFLEGKTYTDEYAQETCPSLPAHIVNFIFYNIVFENTPSLQQILSQSICTPSTNTHIKWSSPRPDYMILKSIDNIFVSSTNHKIQVGYLDPHNNSYVPHISQEITKNENADIRVCALNKACNLFVTKGRMEIWRLNKDNMFVLTNTNAIPEFVQNVALNVDGNTLAVDQCFAIKIWCQDKNSEYTNTGKTIPQVPGIITAIALSGNGKIVVGANSDNKGYHINIWNQKDDDTYQINQTIYGAHLRPITDIAVSDTGSMLTSTQGNGTTKLWWYSNYENEYEGFKNLNVKENVRFLTFCNNNNILLGNNTHSITTWDLSHFNKLNRLIENESLDAMDRIKLMLLAKQLQKHSNKQFTFADPNSNDFDPIFD